MSKLPTTTVYFERIALHIHESVAIQFGINTSHKMDSLKMVDEVAAANEAYSKQLNESYNNLNQREKYVSS